VLKKLGRIIATRRTFGLTSVQLSQGLPESSQDGLPTRSSLEKVVDLRPAHAEGVLEGP